MLPVSIQGIYIHEGKSKSNWTFKKKREHIHYEHTEKKLILLFNVIPLDFNAPVFQRFTSFFLIRSGKKKRFLVASLTNFLPRVLLERIVTADETWMHRYEPESKAQSMAWKHQASPVTKKFRRQPAAGKIMLTIFVGWGGMKGALLVLFTPKDPDLSPSDFRMFGPMKEALKGRRFSSDEEVIGEVENCSKTQPKNFFSEGIKTLVKR
jgi:hypothetical protein